MITSKLQQAFNSMQLTYNEYKVDNTIKGSVTKEVFFDYGYEDDLVKRIAKRSNLENFPLIWYVVSPFDIDTGNVDRSEIDLRVKFVLFTSTKEENYNQRRSLVNYEEILYPLYKKVIKQLKLNRNISIKSENARLTEVYTYGLDVLNNNLDSKNKGQKSGATVYMDALSIEIELIFANNCNNG
jgi:hypothetical protein